MDGNVVRTLEREAPVATKDRILDAAESLFMEHGFEATSLRVDHGRGRRQPRGGQLSLRQQGRAVPGGADAPARSHEPGAHRAADRRSNGRPRRQRCPASRSSPRCSSRRCASRAIPSAAARTSCACWAAPTPTRRRSSASSCRRSTRDDRALQGRVRACAAAPATEGAVVAAPLHHGRAVLHARRHRRAQADRRAHVRPTPTTTRCCSAVWRRSCSPG